MTTFNTGPQPWFNFPRFTLASFGYANARAKRNTRKALNELDSNQLKDIGLYRDETKQLNSRYWELR